MCKRLFEDVALFELGAVDDVHAKEHDGRAGKDEGGGALAEEGPGGEGGEDGAEEADEGEEGSSEALEEGAVEVEADDIGDEG